MLHRLACRRGGHQDLCFANPATSPPWPSSAWSLPIYFPLMFYRSDPADIHLTVEDAGRPATGPASGPSSIRGTPSAGGTARKPPGGWSRKGRRLGFVLLPGSRHAARPSGPIHLDYGRAMRFGHDPLVEVVIGTYEELWGALARRSRVQSLTHGPLTDVFSGSWAETEEMVSRSGLPPRGSLHGGAEERSGSHLAVPRRRDPAGGSRLSGRDREHGGSGGLVRVGPHIQPVDRARLGRIGELR